MATWCRTRSSCRDGAVTDPLAAFNRRLEHLPHDWKGPLVDVIDTFETVCIALKGYGVEDDSFLALGLTQLVIQQHNQRNNHE